MRRFVRIKSEVFSAPIKGISQCYVYYIAMSIGKRTWHIYNTGKTLYIGIEAV